MDLARRKELKRKELNAAIRAAKKYVKYRGENRNDEGDYDYGLDGSSVFDIQRSDSKYRNIIREMSTTWFTEGRYTIQKFRVKLKDGEEFKIDLKLGFEGWNEFKKEIDETCKTRPGLLVDFNWREFLLGDKTHATAQSGC